MSEDEKVGMFFAIALGFIGTVLGFTWLVFGAEDDDIDKLQDRIDALECRLADDEAECLREQLR